MKPWKLRTWYGREILDDSNRTVATVHILDARALIACAPDMLSALQACVTLGNDPCAQTPEAFARRLAVINSIASEATRKATA